MQRAECLLGEIDNGTIKYAVQHAVFLLLSRAVGRTLEVWDRGVLDGRSRKITGGERFASKISQRF